MMVIVLCSILPCVIEMSCVPKERSVSKECTKEHTKGSYQPERSTSFDLLSHLLLFCKSLRGSELPATYKSGEEFTKKDGYFLLGKYSSQICFQPGRKAFLQGMVCIIKNKVIQY